MADKEQIIVEVTYDTDDAQKNVNALTTDIVKLEDANKDLKKQLKDGAISQEDYSKAVESNRVSLAKNKAERKDNIQFLKSEKGSQDQLQKSIKLLTNQRKKLNTETEAGAAKAKGLNDRIDKMRESINDNSSSLEQNKNNIGNYTDSIIKAYNELKKQETELIKNKKALDSFDKSTLQSKKDQEAFALEVSNNKKALKANSEELAVYDKNNGKANSGLAEFGGNLGNISGSLGEMPGPMGQAASGFGGITKAALKFIATPIGFVLALIVTAIKLISSALKRNEGFLDTFNEAWAGISNVIETVIGRIQKLVNIAGKLFKGQISLNEAIEQGSHAFEGMGAEMKAAYAEGVKLAELQKRIENNTIANTTAIAALNAEYEKQTAIADDGTLSFAKQSEALEKAAKAGTEAARLESEHAALALSEINKRVEMQIKQGRISEKITKDKSGRDKKILIGNRVLLKEQAEGIANQIMAESRLTQVIFENNKKRREIALANLNQELDFVFDVVDAKKTAAEKEIANDKNAFNERKSILDETNRLLNESFSQQISLLENQGKVSIDANKLLALNNKESFAYAKSLGLSEEATARLLEVIRERIMATSDLQIAEEEFNSARQKSFDDEESRRDTEMDAELMAIEETMTAEVNAANKVFEANMKNSEALTEQERIAAEQRKQINLATTNILVNSFQDILDARAQSLNRQRQKELENENLTEAQREAISKKYAKKQQRIQISQALISGALAILNALQTQPFIPLGLAAAGAATIATGIQVANIKGATFADGGLAKTGTFGGRSHAAGGTKGVFSDGTKIEVEKDENFYVMKRNASAHINALSTVNERFGGRSFGSGRVTHAADGGQVDTSGGGGGLSVKDVQTIIRSTPIFTKLTDVMSGINSNVEANEVGVV